MLSICIFLIGGVRPLCPAYARFTPAELFNTPAELIAPFGHAHCQVIAYSLPSRNFIPLLSVCSCIVQGEEDVLYGQAVFIIPPNVRKYIDELQRVLMNFPASSVCKIQTSRHARVRTLAKPTTSCRVSG